VAAVAIGTTAYIYQGYAPPSESSTAFSYVASTDAINQLTAVYPSSRQGASAASDGTKAWTFGGEAIGEYKADVIEHDPAGQGTFTTLAAQLPSGRAWTAAVWLDGAAYIFGGETAAGTVIDDIVKFVPSTGSVSLIGHLPAPVKAAAAVATDDYAYLFGGVRSDGSRNDDILQFDPSDNAVGVSDRRLQTPRDGVSAVWDQARYIFLFGGCESSSCGLKQILRYDTDTDRIKAVGGELPTGRGRTAAVWLDGAAYVFGGQQGASTALNQIVKYVPDAPNTPPEPDFDVSGHGLTVDVDAGSSTDAEAPLDLFEWDWGDGSQHGSGATASHVYASSGSKTITLTVTDADGDRASVAATFDLGQTSQGGGTTPTGPIVIWFPTQNPGTSSNHPNSQSESTSPGGADATGGHSSKPVERVDPLATPRRTPGIGLAVFVLALAGFVAITRRR